MLTLINFSKIFKNVYIKICKLEFPDFDKSSEVFFIKLIPSFYRTILQS